MFRGLTGREILLRNPDNGASGSGGTLDAGSAGGNGTGATGRGEGGTPDGANNAPTYESWYAGLDAPTKALVDNGTAGLKSALQSERTERANLARQIADLQKGATKGSDLEKQLTDLQNTLTATERRANFVEDAIRPEVGCVNVKAAFALATAEDLFDRQGRPDWNALKSAAPELFRRAGAGSADGGAGNRQMPAVGMNEMIRRAAGRG